MAQAEQRQLGFFRHCLPEAARRPRSSAIVKDGDYGLSPRYRGYIETLLTAEICFALGAVV